MKPLRGMVAQVNLDPVKGHEPGRSRPCVVVQNDVGNRFSTTAIVVPLTNVTHVKAASPIYVLVKRGDGGASKDSYALCDQIRMVDQERFGRIYGTLAPETMRSIERGLRTSLGLDSDGARECSSIYDC